MYNSAGSQQAELTPEYMSKLAGLLMGLLADELG